MVRARAVLDLADVARHRSSRPPGVPRCSAEVELPLVDVLARMEHVGIAVDVEAT